MTEHTVHIRGHVAAPPVPSGRECPFCHSTGTIKAGSCTSCGTALPSQKAELDKNKLLANGGRYRDRPRKAEPPWYTPQHDGIDELQPDEDEADELAGLDLQDSPDTGFDPDSQDDLLPSDDDLPWTHNIR